MPPTASFRIARSRASPCYGQDAQYGWDVSHTVANRYTSSTATPTEPLVTDNVTGLVWQGCLAGRSGNDCTTGTTSTLAWQAARDYCADLVWGSASDWHLPDEHELLSVIDFGNPADTATFPATGSATFWTSSAYSVNWAFQLGPNGLATNDKSTARAVRCVRHGQVAGSADRFVRDMSSSLDRVITDTWTGLVWQGCSLGTGGSNCSIGTIGVRNWSFALAYCEGLVWGSHADWRLPNVKELFSLVDTRRQPQTIDGSAFPSIAGTYLTSTTATYSMQEDIGDAWNVDLETSFVTHQLKSEALHVMCVRTGP